MSARRLRAVTVAAADVVELDPTAALMQAALGARGYELRPEADACLLASGMLSARLVWRCRARGQSALLLTTIRLPVCA